MMGEHQEQKNLFSYGVDLDRRVRSDRPLRAIKAQIDFAWVRGEVASCCGRNGNVSVDPAVIVKLMLLLFFDDVKSERELMRIVPERLDYLWFLGLGLDDEIPDHSVLSKARARWGHAVFEKLFVRTVEQCVAAGLVDGRKLHMDGSLIEADASRDSVVSSSPELIDALRRAFGAQEAKLQSNLSQPHYEPLNRRLLSTTDPDAPVVRQSKIGGNGDSRPRYKHHRAIDEKCGLITAVVTTPGDVDEPSQTEPLLDQHAANTAMKADTIVADQPYGTNANYRSLQQRGVRTHMGPLFGKNHARYRGILPKEKFRFDPAGNVYLCPAGQKMYPRRREARRRATEYVPRKGVCTACPLHDQCTRSKHGRSLMHHDNQDLIDRAREQAATGEARHDRLRRRHLAEGSFAEARRHHFKRARWRRPPRQRIQDWLIAAIQNIKTRIAAAPIVAQIAAGVVAAAALALIRRVFSPTRRPTLALLARTLGFNPA